MIDLVLEVSELALEGINLLAHIVHKFVALLRLTREEALAINWHMGGYDKRVIGGDMSIANAYYKYPLCTLTHIADIMATYLDETRPS